METKDVDIDHLERGLLSSQNGSPNQAEAEDEDEDETVLYTASFGETEENFVKYQTSRWVLYSLLLILAWGIGFFMLLYVPVRRYILRQDIRSRKLYVTPNAVVYKVNCPFLFYFFPLLSLRIMFVFGSIFLRLLRFVNAFKVSLLLVKEA